jgi:chemotaxis response regulator CheB
MSLGQAAGSIRIVIADDDPSFGRMVQACVSARAELEVVGLAANGREATRLTKELEPDLVLLDVSMPPVDGVPAARTIREGAGAETPTVVLVNGEDDLRESGDFAALMDVIVAVSQLGLPAR